MLESPLTPPDRDDIHPGPHRPAAPATDGFATRLQERKVIFAPGMNKTTDKNP